MKIIDPIEFDKAVEKNTLFKVKPSGVAKDNFNPEFVDLLLTAPDGKNGFHARVARVTADKLSGKEEVNVIYQGLYTSEKTGVKYINIDVYYEY